MVLSIFLGVGVGVGCIGSIKLIPLKIRNSGYKCAPGKKLIGFRLTTGGGNGKADPKQIIFCGYDPVDINLLYFLDGVGSWVNFDHLFHAAVKRGDLHFSKINRFVLKN
jgi:hypothetical protein